MTSFLVFLLSIISECLFRGSVYVAWTCLYVHVYMLEGEGVSQALHREMGVSTLSVTWRDIEGGGGLQ